MMKKCRAFSLVEVALALGVVAFALLAILGLIPVGLSASRAAVEDTRSSLIAQDATNRARAFLNGPAASTATASVTWWYDGEGRFIDQSAGPDFADALYRADVEFGPLDTYPSKVSSGALRAAKVSIGSPADGTDGSLIGSAAKPAVYSLYLRPQ